MAGVIPRNSETQYGHPHGHKKWARRGVVKGRSGSGAEEAEAGGDGGGKKSGVKDASHLRRSSRKRRASNRLMDYKEYSEEDNDQKRKKSK